MIKRLIIDTNVLVPLIDSRDKFYQAAGALSAAIAAKQIAEVYFDCVVVEAVGVLCRRAEEQGRSGTLPSLLTMLEQRVTPAAITWIGQDLQRHYAPALNLVRQTNGALNFNDALLALLCRELGIDAIASFDQDFDQISWLKRVSKPADL